jgi:pimeloyl-ACP methyl ester carboxylesterase
MISEGRGPLIVMLPSRGRDSEDFDDVAAGLAKAGYRVLRPQPRGAGASAGPTENIRMQDLAKDVAHVIAGENAGPGMPVNTLQEFVDRARSQPGKLNFASPALAACPTWQPSF